MKLIPISIDIMTPIEPEDSILVRVGRIAGECYNSSMDADKCVKRALNCIKRGHHTPWEHINITLKCTVDRGVSHALVRHRHCAFMQSSTIYQKFDELVFIDSNDVSDYKRQVYTQAEVMYKRLLSANEAPSSTRDVLPNALATNLIITTNMRQWQYMWRRRNGHGDSNNMHKWSELVEQWLRENYPKITAAFDEYYTEHRI